MKERQITKERNTQRGAREFHCPWRAAGLNFEPDPAPAEFYPMDRPLAAADCQPGPPARAFTLVELLVVIGIIALLISILLPSLNRARETANRVKCASNLRQIGQAMLLYAGENKGNYPRTYFVPGAALTDAAPIFTQTGAGAANPFGGLKGFVGTNNVAAAIFLLIRTQD